MAQPHPAATQHLPSFITAPGETDVLMVVATIVLPVAVLLFGVIYLRLHALPEHVVHRSQKIQAELVCALSLIGLLTHKHIFWVAALVLALIDLPDWAPHLTE